MRDNSPGQTGAGQRQAVILTALPQEYAAVRQHLAGVREDVDERGVVYEIGSVTGPSGGWQVAIAECGAGNVGAGLHASWAIERYHPSIVLFVGVAGGLKDVDIGDVVAATKVYGYESGKASESFKPRPDVGQSSFAIQQRARAVARSDEWLARIKGGVPGRRPRAFVKPIAAGEKVVASTQSAVYQFLRQQYSDAIAVEMEGRGFLQGAWPSPQVQALVVRGISDRIDEKSKADAGGSQELASRHAAAFAIEVLVRIAPLEMVEAHELGTAVPELLEEPVTEKRPSPLAIAGVLLMLLVVSLGSSVAAAYILGSAASTIIVFVFVLLILAIAIPYIGLSVDLVDQSVWFKTYVLVLKRIPGLETVIEMLLRSTKGKGTS